MNHSRVLLGKCCMQQLCGSHILMCVFNLSGLRGLLMLLVCAPSIKEAEGVFILCGNLIEVLRDDGTWKNAYSVSG